jgi:hypothetical protein
MSFASYTNLSGGIETAVLQMGSFLNIINLMDFKLHSVDNCLGDR